jgi:hypothetical protein
MLKKIGKIIKLKNPAHLHLRAISLNPNRPIRTTSHIPHPEKTAAPSAKLNAYMEKPPGVKSWI